MPNTTCVFEDALFHRFVNDAIEAHNPTTPLFMFWAPHTIHAPLEVPKPFYDKYKAPVVGDDRRARYLAMVNWLDTAIGETVDLLKRKGMWEDTLVVLTR
jgi:arylsulfatase I/J